MANASLSKKYFFMISNILLDNTAKLGMTPIQLCLIVVLMRYAYRSDTAYPSLKTIKNITGISKRAIMINLKKLEKKGYITKTKYYRKNNGCSNNVYSFAPLSKILKKLEEKGE